MCLLRRADIIKDSPCILPILNSKGMLAPGSSASYCVALAEKRLCKWLCTAEEEKEEKSVGVGGYGAGCFLFTSSEGGTQTIQSAFPHMCMQTFLLILSFFALSHTLPGSLTLCIFLSPTQYLSLSHSSYFPSGNCVFCLPLLNNAPFLFLSFLCCVVSSCAVSLSLD